MTPEMEKSVVSFVRISGGKYEFIDKIEVRNAIDEAGRKKKVFVEGITDGRIFHILFNDDFANYIAYIPSGGYAKVKEYLNGTIIRRIEGFAGIIDRDFRSDIQRDELINEFDGKIYVHKRYTIENYLIEPKCLVEFVRDHSLAKKITDDDINAIIRKIFLDLMYVMAGNMTLLNFSAGKLPEDIAPTRERVVQHILHKIRTVNGEESKQLEEEVINMYNGYLSGIQQFSENLDELHKVTSGKYFFYNFSQEMKKVHKIKGIRDDEASRYQLARILKTEQGITGELTELHSFLQALCH